jgi:polyphosphate kinase
MKSKAHLMNRELTWLEFNGRVLDEAGDAGNPLLERLKFAAIFSSNLDEFFMVRVAGLRQQFENDATAADPTGISVQVQLQRIRARTSVLVERQYRYLMDKILPGLREEGICLLGLADLSFTERKELTAYFEKQVLPVLTPIAVDPSHPFPILNNGTVEIIVVLQRPSSNRRLHALVEVPSVLPRFIEVKGHFAAEPHRRAYVLLEDIILENIPQLFYQCRILDAFPFRVLRDMDFEVDEEGVADLLAHMEKQLRFRRRREPVRLEVPTGASRKVVHWLSRQLALDAGFVYSVAGPLDVADFFELIEKTREQFTHLLEPEWPAVDVPGIDWNAPVINSIRREHVIPNFPPYENFDPVVRFIEEAAEDPAVLAIKQTLYRVSGDSPVVAALQRAAENGKQVTVIVEVKARFDEERNIAWARQLEESGAHVVYGIVGLKIHCKALLVIRREEGRIRRYLHLATGNYNDRTARIYTDIGVFMDDPDICADVAALFNVMTGYADPPKWRTLAVAPFTLRERFIELIDREKRLTSPHQPGRITAKMNSLVDPEIIQHLHDAATAGVKVELVVRGACCLRPGEGTAKKNIRIVSVVDRYLEHSRIYRFENGGNPEYFLSSADWMPRNLDRRIEILWPVYHQNLREMLDGLMLFALQDKRKGRRLKPDGSYTRCSVRTSRASRSQRKAYEYLKSRNLKLAQGQPRDALQIIRGEKDTQEQGTP